MSEFELPVSSQSSQYDQEQINPEDLASSPLAPRSTIHSTKPKKPPPITPKRFTKFFTPRQSGNGATRSGRVSKSGRQLRDITRNALNRKGPDGRPQSSKLQLEDAFRDIECTTPETRSSKKRKLLPTPESSPLQSSPIKRVQVHYDPIPVYHEDEGLFDASDDEGSLCTLLEDYKPFPKPIRKLRGNDASSRLLQRSFGGMRAIGRGKILDHCSDWQDQTSNFYSRPEDYHSFRGSALPFCTANCNSNSLIAIGDEEGGIRLIDSSGAEGISFAKEHISFKPHNNAVMDIAFSSDDYLLATASGDQTARVIDMRTQQTRFIMAGHISSVKQVRFQPGNDSILATSSRDGSVQVWDLRCRGSEAPALDFQIPLEPGMSEPIASRHKQVIYANTCISIKDAHALQSATESRSLLTKGENARRNDVSITALSFLHHGREHLLLTASEANASVKLWDIRGKYTSRRGPAVPVSATREPETHNRHRHFGLSSMVLSGDGGRLYTLCKDSTVYAYSTNHLILGHAPELTAPLPKWRRSNREGQVGLGPLYGFRHPQFHATSFYVKASMRKAKDDQSEMLAVGSRDGCAVLFPTDERFFKRPQPTTVDEDEEDEEDDLPTLPSQATRPTTQRTASSATASSRWQDNIPIYEQGTALVRGHQSEVTSLTWTADGELVTVGDDFMARCWREGPQARDLRVGGEAEGRRWGCGWAEVREGYDDEE